MIYGSYPAKRFQKSIDLKPVMNLTTKIISLKKVPQGTSISYGRTFTCKRESLIATLPIGYADGYSRSLSNRGEVLIRERKAPVVGVVCMDLVMIDATDIPGVSLGDEVILMGSQGSEVITAEDVAEKMDTISYEFLCGIGPRIPRIYTKGGTILQP
jgi:alanine racemase